ncbi:MAG: RNA polymerase sigma factor [Gemmataceae bacterium]
MESEPRSNSEVEENLRLFRKARTGDWGAFQELVGGFQGRVFAVTMRITGQRQDAEDATQQTFLSVIEHMEQFREESTVATWILRIATNHALKILRKRRGLPTVSLESPAEADNDYATLPHPDYIAEWQDNPADLAQRAEVREILDQKLSELDDKYRVVFVLRDIEGFSVRESAEMLGLTEANVKVRLLRARLVLREKLTQTFGDEATRVFPDHSHE